jgi:hypothetical protein
VLFNFDKVRTLIKFRGPALDVVLYLTKRKLKALKVLSQNQIKGENGLVIIDLSFPLPRAIFLLSITLQPLIMSTKVKEKLLFLMHPTRNGFSRPKNVRYGKNNVVKRSTSNVDNNTNGTTFESKKYAYSNNYKGKNPMTRTRWRRYERSKKGIATSLEDENVNPKGN